ncbi:MAG: hypothetical protein U0325_23145 [Polyangiales bacterium]
MCARPAAGAAKLPLSTPGASRGVVLPSPSCPRSFAPQQDSAAPSRAQVCAPPRASASAWIPVTRVGVARATVLPSPSCPRSFAPQHHTLRSIRRAQA